MKLIHLSDLHLGKRVNEFSMLEDQKYILREILGIIEAEQPDGVIIAGDVYDKAIPPAEAVALLDEFLVRLAGMKQEVFVISGNHDSAERIAFGSRLMQQSGIHLSPVFSGRIAPVVLKDAEGEAHVWMLPFVKPVDVRRAYPEEEITDYTDAVRTVIRHMETDPSVRNVLVAHQFVTGAVRSESEDVSVGGMDNVDASVFDGFDYVALGHIHSAYAVGRDTVRYAGSPLAYHFNETRQPVKGPLLVTLAEKDGTPLIERQEIEPLHRMREIRGTYDEVRKDAEATRWEMEYLKIILTDTRITSGIADFLRDTARAHGSEVMELTSEYHLFEGDATLSGSGELREKPVEELFADFYTQRRQGVEPEKEDLDLMALVGEMTRSMTAGAGEPEEKDFRRILDFVLEQEGEGK